MIGTRLGAWDVLAELGSGGMGKVYRAEATREVAGLAPGCAVALKVIHAHLLETEGFFQRFLREADIGRSVEHENVVRTYLADALLHEGVQQNFLVMEYVEGQTLRGLLQELERVPEELCRHIGREVAKGLAAIHEAGVVHRDLKPENVLITEDHQVKIMDLGVARLQDEAIRLSQTGVFVGSLEYAAPEQFQSKGEGADGRADLHALGVMLYELSTGQHPYRDDDARKVLRNILDEAPRKAGEVNPQLSPFFEEAVQTLLAKDRSERFASAAGLAAVLEEGEESAWWKEKAKALRLETKRPLRRIRIPRETALYGRDDDLAKLQAPYEQAKAGDGQVLLIEGEAGIGKTRLIDEFVGRLREQGEDVNFLFGSYPPGGAATAAGAFSTAYREHFGEDGLESALHGYLGATPLLIPAYAALLRGDAAPADAEPLTKDSLQTVFVHATRALAAEHSTVVLIDDLHFAPEEGRALFASLTLAVPDHRVLLIGTMRPGVPEDWIANVERLEHASCTSLQRLGPKDLTLLLGDAFRSERLAEELAYRIAQKSDGNPFFAFEIIRGLREGQFIKQRPDGTWVTTQVIGDIEVPSSVLDLVNARVADLTEAERDLLDVAACCGFEFEAGLVAEATGVPRIPCLKRFGQIERRHRLVRTAGRRCVFDHHQVQEALYASLMPELREAYHEAIGDALTRRHPEPDGAVAVELCEHYLEGGRGDKALPRLEEALDHLEGSYLHADVHRLLARALALPDLVAGERRFDLLVRQFWCLETLGRSGAMKPVLSQVHEIAEATGSRRQRAVLENVLGNWQWLQGHGSEATSHYERCLELAHEIGDNELAGKAIGNLGAVHFRQGSHEEARAHLEKGVDLLREQGDLRGEARVLFTLGGCLGHLGLHEKAEARLERSLEIARDVGDRRIEASGLGNLASMCYRQARIQEARALFEQSLAIIQEVGSRRDEAYCTANLGSVLIHAGTREEAQALLDRGLELAQEIGDGALETLALSNLGAMFAGQGSYADAQDSYSRVLSRSRELSLPETEALALRGLGDVLLAGGRLEEAGTYFEMALAIAEKQSDKVRMGRCMLDLGAVAEEMGELDEARRRYERARELYRREGWVEAEAGALMDLGRTHVVAGDVEAARPLLLESIALLRPLNRPTILVQVLSLFACLPDGDYDGALSVLEEAGEGGNTPEVQFYLWRASDDRKHLMEAKRLLDQLVRQAPEEYRDSMLTNVRLHRDIVEAWAKHGEKEAGA